MYVIKLDSTFLLFFLTSLLFFILEVADHITKSCLEPNSAWNGSLSCSLPGGVEAISGHQAVYTSLAQLPKIEFSDFQNPYYKIRFGMQKFTIENIDYDKQ